MNYTRIALAAVAATVAYFAIGGITFAVLPLANEFRKYPAIFRTQDAMKSVMPVGMIAMLLAMLALAALYALASPDSSSIGRGATFGALIGIFAIGAFVMHNYVNLNIGLTLALEQAGAYFVQWVLVGVVIGAIYRP
jgi:hypothetical protein